MPRQACCLPWAHLDTTWGNPEDDNHAKKKAEPRDGETSISSVYLIFDNLDPAMPEATPGIYNLSCDSD